MYIHALQIDFNLLNENFESCHIQLDQPGFDLDAYDGLRGGDLQGCNGFILPNHNLPLIEIQMFQADWYGESIRVFFDDGVYTDCHIDQFINVEETLSFNECRVPFTVC